MQSFITFAQGLMVEEFNLYPVVVPVGGLDETNS
jgi:hypothetical protein